MKTASQLTPRERLRRIVKISPLLRPSIGRRDYLITLALLMLLATVIVIGILGGRAADDLFRHYTDQIYDLTTGGQ